MFRGGFVEIISFSCYTHLGKGVSNLKDFKDFKATLPTEKITEIVNSRIEKVNKAVDNLNLEDPTEEYLVTQRSQIVGLIFDFLEEYHKWLNS